MTDRRFIILAVHRTFFRFFEQMSSIKTRKHYVIADAGFSAVWAAFYFLAFAYMSFCWSKTPFTYDFAQANALGSILFSLLSAAAWVSEYTEQSSTECVH